jgi:secondary thiamine-phosphate synthase enzyme
MQARQFSIRSSSQIQFINIDSYIRAAVQESGTESGLCTVFVPHTTAGVTINENADPDVVRDIIMEANKIVPLSDGYHHSEGNSAAHIKSSLFGPSLTLIIENGRVVYGTWQSVYFCEFDGPRSRRFLIKIVQG